MKNYIVGFIAVVALVVGVIGISKQSVVKQGAQGIQGERGAQGIQGERGLQGPKGETGAMGMTGKFGAVSGPDIYGDLNVKGVITSGSGAGIATTTTATTYTFVKKDLEKFSLIDIMQNTGNSSFTLPATSTMIDLLQGVGASRQWLIHNATTSTNTMTLIAGAGMDLVAVTANDDVIDAGEYTQLTCTQIPYRAADNENIVCIVDELANAD